jgi:hypothetical protein
MANLIQKVILYHSHEGNIKVSKSKLVKPFKSPLSILASALIKLSLLSINLPKPDPDDMSAFVALIKPPKP